MRVVARLARDLAGEFRHAHVGSPAFHVFHQCKNHAVRQIGRKTEVVRLDLVFTALSRTYLDLTGGGVDRNIHRMRKGGKVVDARQAWRFCTWWSLTRESKMLKKNGTFVIDQPSLKRNRRTSFNFSQKKARAGTPFWPIRKGRRSLWYKDQPRNVSGDFRTHAGFESRVTTRNSGTAVMEHKDWRARAHGRKTKVV